MIKLPEDQATQGEETFVEIFASFMAAMVCASCMFYEFNGTIRTFGHRRETRETIAQLCVLRVLIDGRVESKSSISTDLSICHCLYLVNYLLHRCFLCIVNNVDVSNKTLLPIECDQPDSCLGKPDDPATSFPDGRRWRPARGWGSSGAWTPARPRWTSSKQLPTELATNGISVFYCGIEN